MPTYHGLKRFLRRVLFDNKARDQRRVLGIGQSSKSSSHGGKCDLLGEKSRTDFPGPYVGDSFAWI